MAGLKQDQHVNRKMTEVEHTEQLKTPRFGIVFVTFTLMRRIVQSETSYHTRYGHISRDSLVGGGCRGITRRNNSCRDGKGWSRSEDYGGVGVLVKATAIEVMEINRSYGTEQ